MPRPVAAAAAAQPAAAPVLGVPSYASFNQSAVAVVPLGNPTLTHYTERSEAALRNSCGAPKSFMDAALDPGAGLLTGPTLNSFATKVLSCSSQADPSHCVSNAVIEFVAENHDLVSSPGQLSRVWPPYAQTLPGSP
jgi:hypothetical protein